MNSKIHAFLDDLSLPFDASYLMSKCDSRQLLVGDTLIVGYIAEDDNAYNPFKKYEMLGGVASYCGRANTHDSIVIRQALATDQNGNKLLQEIEAKLDELAAYLKPLWIEAAVKDEGFQMWARKEHFDRYSSEKDRAAFYKQCAIEMCEETWGVYDCSIETVASFNCYIEVKKQAWEHLRNEGLIGDPYAVMFDYSDGLLCASSSTRSGSFNAGDSIAMWTANNDELRKWVDRLARVYAFGTIEEHRSCGGDDYTVDFIEGVNVVSDDLFPSWKDAFDYMEHQVTLLMGTTKGKIIAQKRKAEAIYAAARYVASNSAKTYNDWMQGDVFGLVVAQYTKVENAYGDVYWDFASSDETWCYIGKDSAISELESIDLKGYLSAKSNAA